jgi:hypothetical protein
VTAHDPERYGKIPAGDRTVPNLVAALALPYERASRRTEQIPQRTIELRSHSDNRGFRPAERGDLQKN